MNGLREGGSRIVVPARDHQRRGVDLTEPMRDVPLSECARGVELARAPHGELDLVHVQLRERLLGPLKLGTHVPPPVAA